jgi:putative phage-type endonuclease
MDRQEFLERRRSGLGGSDAAAAVGICPWKSKYQLYVEKTETNAGSAMTEAMRWGSLLEPAVRQRYCDVTGNAVTVFESQMHHPNHPWMIANLDGQVSPTKLYEGKTYWTAEGWGPNGSDEVPEHYALQVQHYMAVTGAESTDIAVLIAGSDFRILTVYADKELQSLLIERESEFWHEHVVPRIPPEPTTDDDVRHRFPVSLGDMVEADVELVSAWNRLREVRSQIKTFEAEKESLEIVLKRAIGNRDGLEYSGSPLVTWKSAKDSMSFDRERFQAERPEVYRQYLCVSNGSRRFLVKEPKVKK